MTDLLTKEEREEVEGVRHRWQHERSDSVDTGKLLAIIDNLSKRWVKKYAIESLHDHAEYKAHFAIIDGVKYKITAMELMP